jgi:hypothetical protein
LSPTGKKLALCLIELKDFYILALSYFYLFEGAGHKWSKQPLLTLQTTSAEVQARVAAKDVRSKGLFTLIKALGKIDKKGNLQTLLTC